MQQRLRSVQRLFDAVEPVLAHCAETGDVGAAKICRRLLQLFAGPPCKLYAPAKYLDEHREAYLPPGGQLFAEPVSEELVGAPGLVVFCLKALLASFDLAPDSRLEIALFEEEDTYGRMVRLGIGLDGLGSAPKEVDFEGFFRLSLEEFGERWTLVTQGGRVDKAANGLMLRLNGMRMPPEAMDEAAGLLERLPIRPEQEDYDRALAYLDGEVKPAPGDLGALIREVFEEKGEELDARSLHHEVSVADGLPPIVLSRPHMRSFFIQLCSWACWALPPERSLEVLVEYDATARQAACLATLDATKGSAPESYHVAALRRAVAAHGGSIDVSAEGSEVVVSAAFPDKVGATLDGWLPGWEAFTARSQQMLRLLKSGGQTPPEDFLLGGVLEEELSALLWERLNTPLARNVADEVREAHPEAIGGSGERLHKALNQVAKGKPKKELCQPGYAAELLWAFRGDERRRYTLGAQALSEEELRELCEGLAGKPGALLVCLRILARCSGG